MTNRLLRAPTLLLLLAITSVLAGCNQLQAFTPTSPDSPVVDQANLCEVKDWQHNIVAKACKPGQKVVYLPETWGNEQLPVIFAAVNCDLRFGVTSTKGAVTCIYQPITP